MCFRQWLIQKEAPRENMENMIISHDTNQPPLRFLKITDLEPPFPFWNFMDEPLVLANDSFYNHKTMSTQQPMVTLKIFL